MIISSFGCGILELFLYLNIIYVIISMLGLVCVLNNGTPDPDYTYVLKYL